MEVWSTISRAFREEKKLIDGVSQNLDTPKPPGSVTPSMFASKKCRTVLPTDELFQKTSVAVGLPFVNQVPAEDSRLRRL